jgi:hypothetical protein
MTTAKDVAAYMTFELKRRGGELFQDDISVWILRRFGREYVSAGRGCYQGFLKIRKDVLREFRAMNPDVEWTARPLGMWRFRKPGPTDQSKESTKKA